MSSILIKNGIICDGTGNPAWRGDVAVSGDRITSVSTTVNASASQLIDAEGMIVCPGFIDMHSHSDMVLPDYPATENMIQQGITTEVVGQCGFSPAPVPSIGRRDFYDSISFFRAASDEWPWETFDEYLSFMEGVNPIVNIVPLVGHGAIRATVMGFENRAPTSTELTRMCQELERALDAGAWGLSTGLVYPPGCFAKLHELVEMARIVAARDAIYFSHIRGEGDTLLDAIDELIATGEIAQVATQISHFKASGRRNWDKQSAATQRIYDALERGVDIAADVMPTNASGTTLMSLLPDWVKEGGPGQMKLRLQDRDSRRQLSLQLVDGCPGWSNLIASTGYENMYVFGCPSEPSIQGQSILNIAADRGHAPHDVVIDLVAKDGADIFLVFETMNESNIETAICEHFSMIGSDGWSHPEGTDLCRLPHPRSYGSYPKVLGQYVRSRKIISDVRAIHKMTGKVASRLGLADRGQIKSGMKADIVIYDPARVSDNSSIQNPMACPQGIEWVLVNGTVAVDPEGVTGERAGNVLRRSA